MPDDLTTCMDCGRAVSQQPGMPPVLRCDACVNRLIHNPGLGRIWADDPYAVGYEPPMLPPAEPEPPPEMPTPPPPQATSRANGRAETTTPQPPPRRRDPIAGRMLDRAKLANLPQPVPLIINTLDRRTVALLAGYRASGKSFIAQDWAACVATGKRWQGRTAEQGTVLYVAAEGVEGLDRRLSAWEYAWQHDIPPAMYDVLPVPVNLLKPDEVADLAALCRGRALVVIDTLARCLVGGDENSAQDMGLAVDALFRLRDATGNGTVLAVHHTGKDRQTIRGSSALDGGLDTIYTTEGTAADITLCRVKRKEGPEYDVHRLELVKALESVVVSVPEGGGILDSAGRLESHFRSHFGAIGATARQLQDTCELSRSAFYRALKTLVERGVLVNVGTFRLPFYKLTAP